jgi:hypothetical protein
MIEIVQQIVNGLTIGGVYALIALGLTAVFGILGIVRAVRSLLTELRRAREKGNPRSAADFLAANEQSAIQVGLTLRKIGRILKWIIWGIVLVFWLYACSTSQKG